MNQRELVPTPGRDSARRRAATLGQLARVQELLDEGANVDSRCLNTEKTALHSAAEFGHAKVVKLLLQRGADLGATDRDGKTPLHLAGDTGQIGAFLVLHRLLYPGQEIRTERGRWFEATRP